MFTLTRNWCLTYSTNAWNSSSIVAKFCMHLMHIMVVFFTLLLHWFNFWPNTQQVKNYNISKIYKECKVQLKVKVLCSFTNYVKL
jgi:hypothetical protein